MDVAAVTTLINTVGIGGVFLYATFYLMKRMEAKETERALESREREARLERALAEADQGRGQTEAYIRSTLSTALHETSQAMRDSSEKCSQAMYQMTTALEGLACRDLRREDVKSMVDQSARRRTGD